MSECVSECECVSERECVCVCVCVSECVCERVVMISSPSRSHYACVNIATDE